jgi:4-hydroxybenzoate polyprenyltransferase
MLAYGRLLRLSLAPSAAADIAAGVVLAAGWWPASWRPWLLMLASLCVYHGGMALNDWADRAEDVRSRPARPIPSGAVSARSALLLALALLLAGPLLAYVVAPRCALVLGAVSVLAGVYDLTGRGPWMGPLLLAACRMGNLGAGVALGLGSPGHGATFYPHSIAVYGLYVYCVSRVARLEDTSDSAGKGSGARLGLGLAGALLALVGTIRMLLWLRHAGHAPWPRGEIRGACAGAAIALWGALGLIRRSLRRAPWHASGVMAAVGMALRRLLVATAAIAAQAGTRDGLWVAAAILCGYPVSHALRRVFPPT